MAVSERRTCRTVGQPRSTQRYAARRPADEQRLVEGMLALVRQHPRYGYRRIWAILRREGWRVNRKRVYRLWRREGLKVPRKARKRRCLGSGANGCARLRPAQKDHVWAWDFIHDRTTSGGPLKWLTIVDEYTRECLSLVPARSLTATEVQTELIRLFRQRGAPAHIRSDNGPEFIAGWLRSWLARAAVTTLYIQPGAPWENGYAEGFQSRLRDELLNVEEFGNVREAEVLGAMWKRMYNHERPHSALGYRTPVEFARACAAPGLGSLGPPPHTSLAQETLIATGT